jgi:hypothetical protein
MCNYIIKRITDKNDIDRTDGRYPLRIGRRFKFYELPYAGNVMYLEYQPRDGENYSGCLRTSLVEDVFASMPIDNEYKPYVTVQTKNSIYYFEEE